jgi:hypothetical protein
VSGDVEFLDLEDGTGAVDEFVEGQPRPGRTRRRALLAGVAAVAVLAAVIVRTSPSGPDRPVVAPPLPHPVPVPSATLTVPGPSPFGAGNLTMTYGGGRLFALSSTRLGVLDPGAAGRAGRRSSYVSLDLATQESFGLVWDAPARSLWLMPLFGRQPGILREFGSDLRPRRVVQLSDTAHAGSVLDGSLYVSTNSGIERVGRSGRPRQVPIPARAFHRYGAFGDLQADPTRHRLLYLTYSYSAYLESWSPRTGQNLVVRLSVANPTLAVVAGQIWVAGFQRHAGVVLRLDPTTLLPVATSPLAPELGPGAVIVDSGRASFFVRSGTDPGPLWCLDAADGRVRQRWAGPSGPVAGSGRNLYVATTSAVQPLTIEGCPG